MVLNRTASSTSEALISIKYPKLHTEATMLNIIHDIFTDFLLSLKKTNNPEIRAITPPRKRDTE
jgi:hypothetical protein